MTSHHSIFKMRHLFLMGAILFPLFAYADGMANGGGSGGSPPDDDDPPPCCSSCGCPDGGPSDGSGKPVNLYTGRELHSVTDMVIKGKFPIELERHYDSGTRYDSPLGYGWAFSFDQRLYQYPDDSVVLRVGTGQRYHYVKSGNSYVSPPGGIRGQLVEQTDGSFILTYTTGLKEYYSATGLLTAQVNKNGDKLEFTYTSTKKNLTGTSDYAINIDAPMTVAKSYQLTKIEERLADGNLTGHYVDFSYDTNTGRLNSATSHESRTVTYTHDSYTYSGNTSTRGNLKEVQNPVGVKSIYKYEDTYDHHNLTWIEEGEGTTPYVNTYGTANKQDRVTQQTHGNDTLVFDYVIPHLQTQVTHTVKDQNGANPVSYVTNYHFNDVGYTSKVVDHYNNEIRYYHSAQDSRLIRKEWWKYSSTPTAHVDLYRTEDYKHDTDGNRIYEAKGKTVFPGGVVSELLTPVGPSIVTETTYDHGRVTEEKTYEKNASGNLVGKVFVTQYTYYKDSNNVPTNLKDTKRQITTAPTWYTETRAYNSRGLLESITYPDSTQQIYEYASNSLYPTKIYWKIGGTASAYLETEYEYDARGNRTKMWDGNNNLTQYEYDSLNRLTKITNALGEEALYTYNSSTGLLEQTETGKTTAGAGIITKLVYDNNRRLTQMQRKGTGGSFETLQSFVYDSAGRRLQAIDANSHAMVFVYDALDRVTSVTDANSHATTYTYDMLGNRLTTTDALNRVTAFTYNDLWQMASMVEQGVTPNASTTYGYDASGNITSITDAEGRATLYTYDGLGNRLTEVFPMGQTITRSYDNRNRLAQVVYPRGQKKTYDYFAWGAVQYIKIYNSSNTLQSTQTVAYDYAGNTTGLTDDAVQSGEMLAISYDALNRPDVSTVKYLPGGNRTIDNSYNRFGMRSGFAYDESGTSNDYSHSYTYDVEGKLSAASLNSQDYGFSYFDNDQLNTLTYPNGVTQGNTYLNSGPIDTITVTGNSTLETLDYGYNAVNSITSLANNSGTTGYSYDGQDHLAAADFPTGSGLSDESYAYDKIGNREAPGNASLWQYNNNHQLTQDPSYTYSYDADGNITSRSVLSSPADPNASAATFTHNENNRLTGYSNTGQSITASYLYGPSEQRLKKTVNSTTTWFLYDGSQLIAEFNSSGALQKRYDYLPGQYAPVQMSDANGSYQVHSDHLSTPFMMTNSSKAVVWTAKHQAFGQTTVNEDPDANSTNITFNMRFPGQYYDSETQLHDNWHRTYNPDTGRYIQRDPIGLGGGVNVFGYAGQNPVMYVDSTGLLAPAIITGEMILELILTTSIVKDMLNRNSSSELPASDTGEDATADAADGKCDDDKTCDPPEGTVCYGEADYGRAHNGISPHYHLWQMQRRRSDNVCQWRKLGGKNAPAVPPAGAKPCSTYPNWSPS